MGRANGVLIFRRQGTEGPYLVIVDRLFRKGLQVIVSVAVSLAAASGQCRAQAAGELPRILFSVSRVGILKESHQIGSASGFFYRAKTGVHFFVTNRHAVRGEGLPSPPDSIRLKLHSSTSDLGKCVDVTVNLLDKDGNPFFIDGGPEQDLAMVPIRTEQLAAANAQIEFVSADYFVPEEFVVSAGEDVIVVGYPLGAADEVHNLPLFRSASVASAYGVDYLGVPRCLIDGNLQRGMSGSPIFAKPSFARVNKAGALRFPQSALNAYMFLGVLSQTVPVPFPGTPGGVHIGLNDCWYPRLLETLASRFGKP